MNCRIFRYPKGVYDKLILNPPEYSNGCRMLNYAEWNPEDRVWIEDVTSYISEGETVISRREMINYKVVLELEK